ncbi:hypothetical protein AWC12_03155 [Mycolicibacterium iranicum]|uniref:Uncharacterized protein n=1 Tax=Mycolicibacterium iranicum TaxID=912594 RepID=A0A1X1WZJ1_MYCIR|nr:hypothetical protein AWC12_03155 [Mycolicibacterium iranicum]
MSVTAYPRGPSTPPRAAACPDAHRCSTAPSAAAYANSAVDLAFERVLRSVIHGPASTGAPILDMLGGPRCTTSNAARVVGAAA